MIWFRSNLLVLPILFLFLVRAFKLQSDPKIDPIDISSATAELSDSSQEVLSSVAEEPVPGEPSVVESKPEPEVPSQPEPSSVPEEPPSVTESPASQAESSEPELPTVPFVIHANDTSEFIISPLDVDAVISETMLSMDEFKATLIRNSEELAQAGYSIEKAGEKSESDSFPHGDAYFKEFALIRIQIDHPSSSMDDEFNFITRSGDQLIINWSLMPFDGPPLEEGYFYAMDGAVEYLTYWLEVKKADVEGITEVIGQRSSQAE